MTTAPFSQQQLDRYLANSSRCPYCNSGEIEAGQHEHTGDECYQSVVCQNCKAKWTDIYTLTSAEPVEPVTPPQDKGAPNETHLRR